MKEVPKDKTPPRWRLVDREDLKVQFQFEWRDWWFGIFWRTTKIALHFYICILPTIPLHITIARIANRQVGELWCSWCDRWVLPEKHQNDHVQYLRMSKPAEQTGRE